MSENAGIDPDGGSPVPATRRSEHEKHDDATMVAEDPTHPDNDSGDEVVGPEP